jgi:hypothetical protein
MRGWCKGQTMIKLANDNRIENNIQVKPALRLPAGRYMRFLKDQYEKNTNKKLHYETTLLIFAKCI